MSAPEREAGDACLGDAGDACLGDAALGCAFQVSALDICSGQQDTRQDEERLLIEEEAEKLKIPPQDGAFSPNKFLAPIESLGRMCRFPHMIDANLGRSCDRIVQKLTPRQLVVNLYRIMGIACMCLSVYMGLDLMKE